MRQRHQKGSLKIRNGNWIAQWWQEGHRRNKVLGKIRKVTKSEAEDKLADILAPINGDQDLPSSKMSFDDFVKKVYLPFCGPLGSSSSVHFQWTASRGFCPG
jgi:hypothetical protein